MKNALKTFTPLLLIVIFSYFAGVGMKEKCDQYFAKPSISVSENHFDNGWQLKEPSDSAEYIDGPLVASTGELCVFRLSDMKTKADWVIVPPATCYIDSSGSSLAFASNVPSKYSIIAAVVEDGEAKILTHVCEYGTSPEPIPNPSPTPTPKPTPIPTPTPQPANLGDWIRHNIPDAGRGQCAALSACYESAADAIDKGSIKTPDAAFSVVRTATQTKIKPDIWGPFLDQLSSRINEKLDGNTEVKRLGVLFHEIAEALKSIVPAGANIDDPIGSIPDIFSFPIIEAHSVERSVA